MKKDIDNDKNQELSENSPDKILEAGRPRGEEYEGQTQNEPAGNNLETQHPTEEQVSGEDDVGGIATEDDYLDERGIV